MKERRIAIAPHRSNYPDPITLTKGDVVTLGRTDDEYPGWIRAQLQNGNRGWAPESILTAQGDGTAIVTTAYCAHELDTELDEILESARELRGWFWARNMAGEEGWVPLKTTRPIDV